MSNVSAPTSMPLSFLKRLRRSEAPAPTPPRGERGALPAVGRRGWPEPRGGRGAPSREPLVGIGGGDRPCLPAWFRDLVDGHCGLGGQHCPWVRRPVGRLFPYLAVHGAWSARCDPPCFTNWHAGDVPCFLPGAVLGVLCAGSARGVRPRWRGGAARLAPDQRRCGLLPGRSGRRDRDRELDLSPPP